MPDLTVAQNIFIGREPRRAGFFLERARAERAGAGALRAPRPRRSTRREPVGDAHRRQAADGRDRARRSRFDAQRADHGRADRGAQRRRGRDAVRADPPLRRARAPASSTSRTGWTSCARIADRITVLRDGRYVDTLDDRADRPMREVISLMVGREIARRARRPGRRHRDDARSCSRSTGCRTKSLLRDVSFDLHARRDPRLRRPHGRRAHRGRPRARRRGPPRRRHDRAARARRSTSEPGRGRAASASATSPRTASSSGCCSSSERATRTSC